MAEMMNPFMSCPDLKLPRALELLQSNFSSHLRSVVYQDYDIALSQERAAEGKAFLKTELRIWSFLLLSWGWEPHCARRENYSLWLVFPLICCAPTQRHGQTGQVILLHREKADGGASNTASPWELLGGMTVSCYGGIYLEHKWERS